MLANAGQILAVADAVAKEKDIPKAEVFEAIELAFAKAAKQKYGLERDIRAFIDPVTGDVQLKLYQEVVGDDTDTSGPVGEDGEIEEDPGYEMRVILLSKAQKQEPEIKVGEFVTEDLPPLDFGRIAAQSARQVIQQKVKESERKREYAEFHDKVGTIVNGRVKRLDFGNVVLDLGKGEGLLRKDELIARETFRQGDTVRAYIYDVKEDKYGPQVFISRTHPQFLAKLFAQEVQEVYDGTIEIKAVARDPGSRAKMAVFSYDPSIDPRGACIGMRGSRVQAVKSELRDENIDVIQWNDDPATFIIDALYPAQISKVVLDEEERKMDVIVEEEQLSLAIGRRGQNVRLASKLSGWDLDIMTEAQESEKAVKEIETRSELFMQALDVDEVISRLLATEGFASIEDIAYVDVNEIALIQGFDGDIASELQNRAKTALEQEEVQLQSKLKEFKLEEDLMALEGMTPKIAVCVAEHGEVRTLDDFADLATDELLEMLPPKTLEKAQAEAMIMKAREHWFADEVEEQPEESEAPDEADADPAAEEPPAKEQAAG